MKIIASVSLLAHLIFWMFGYERLFLLTRDDPELFKTVLDRLGHKIYEMLEISVQVDAVGAVLIGDDLGFKTSTMLSPEFLRKWIFPWHRRFAGLAHKHGKSLWYHCCGYKDSIMEDLIDYIKIDALHSFEDSCCPVVEYKKEYGHRIGLLGGIDVDRLARYETGRLRQYVRDTLSTCMENGRYALGSGNSITNYVPVHNYLVMLEEGMKWKV